MIAKILQTEPARFVSVIAAVLGLALSFGLLTQTRADAWVAIATAALPVILPLIQGAITRQTVYAPDTVQKIADAATELAPGTAVDIGKPPDASPPLPEGEG